MDKDALRALYDRELRMNMRLPEFIYENTGRILRDYSFEDGSGFIDYCDLDESNADAEIEAQVAFFSSLGLPFTWKVYDHDRPADLRQRLADHGFEVGSADAILILDLQQSALLDADTPAAAVRPVTDAAGIEDIVRLEEAVWQSPRDWLRRWLLHLQQTHPEMLSLFAVEDGGQTVSAAWTFYDPGTSFAHLLGGSTLPEYRKRGYYSALLAIRAREARRRGVRFLTVDASPMSRPILERHGFECLGLATRCRWKPKA